MGRKDIYQFNYLDSRERFADQVNGALFGGMQVVKPGELVPDESRTVYLGREAGEDEPIDNVVDKTYMWRGRRIHIIAVQNQSYTDYRMVLRNMLSESIGYHRQWRRMKAAHRKAQDQKKGSEAFLSGMDKGEKFTPIITLVVYCGAEHGWDGAKCLHDLLDIDEEMKEYVTNYKLNLYDCHDHDTFAEYRTGLRQLFETVRYGRDKEKLRKVMEADRESYSSMDSDTRHLIEVVAKVKISEEYKKMENGEEKYNMCKAIEDMIADGKAEGKIEGKIEGRLELLIQLVCKKLQKNKTAAVIADELEEELTEIEKVIEAQQRAGDYDVQKICRLMMG